MGYQALLFCPDEKTARTITQVLGELDFDVVACTEPFAAVKKLMSERFDAVVVDCDNEQNAALLFKSARNAPNNQSALAVAAVEGQAGVAKAFRLGANLVLTKPINVEQAKGTLRVARGLLRKNDSTKSAPASTTPAAKTLPREPLPGKPVLVPNAAPAVASPTASHLPATSAPPQAPVSQPSLAASASSAVEIESSKKISDEVASALAKIAPASVPESKPLTQSNTAAPPVTRPQPTPTAGAASAAAPAREREASEVPPKKAESIVAEPEKISETKDTAPSANVKAETSPAPASTIGFAGIPESGVKPASGGSKKGLIAVAVIVLAVAGGYAAWTQFGHSGAATPPSAPTPSGSASRAAAPPSAPITVQQPSPAPVAPSLATQPVPEKTKTLPPPSQTHSGKASPAIESSKPPAAAVEENKSPATSQPIVIRKQTPAAQSAPSNDAPVAITGIAPSAGSPALPNLLSNQTSAPAPILQTLSVSQGVSQGLVIKKTSPSYPTNALRMRIEGSVQLLATISKKGDISSVKIISGDPSLARSAVDAVKQWKYKPYLLDGTPVEIQTQITVNFKLPR